MPLTPCSSNAAFYFSEACIILHFVSFGFRRIILVFNLCLVFQRPFFLEQGGGGGGGGKGVEEILKSLKSRLAAGTAVFINLASLQSKAHCTNGWASDLKSLF